MARLQKEDFDVGSEIKKLLAKDTQVGGIVTFLGTVRDISKGKKVIKLEFEHYPGMAENELNQIELDTRKNFDIIDILIIHRTGEIAIGGNIVLIVVTSIHRQHAFQACEWAIDELKKKVPIWKKEFYSDGEHWVGHTP